MLAAAVRLGLLLVALGVASSVAAPRIFCCHDESGKQVCGDILPAACYGRAYRELGQSGRTSRVVEAPLTAAERAAKEAEDKRFQEEQRVLNEQRRKDQALLNTYGSEKDIELMRSRAERNLEASIAAAEERIAEIRKHRKKFENEAEFYKNRRLPAEVAKGLRDADYEIRAQESVIDAKRKDMDATRLKYDEDLRRFIDISRRAAAARR
ncbi:hypothetical protein [Candidatus Accumulibacter sp. ACC003]|uniref:hypothetical protein n=1 Tax=Candidatus Accumulibacter sp. ACC003 TaxID=2823334 RepID=UPI0025B9ADF0|nr:hypothetical protein [Candidatus Accumulibacter sp. ACC003]